MGLNDINSLSHTKWNCKYHIVFAPKYRRKVFYGQQITILRSWQSYLRVNASCEEHRAMPACEKPRV